MSDPVLPLSIPASGLQFSGYATGPADAPTALLLHGFPQRSTSWGQVAARLAEAGIRCVAVDQRGYSPGARPADVAAYALSQLVADAVAIIEWLGGPVHLVGHDWGAVVGWQVASRFPAAVRTWSAVSTPHPLALDAALAGDTGQREQFGYMQLFRQAGVAEQALLGADAAGLRAVYGGAVAPERVAEDVAFFREPGALTAALNWYRAMAPGVNDGLTPVTVPTTYVWGSADQAFGAAAAHTSGQWVQAAYEFVALEGASHWLPDEAPDTVADAVARRILG